jgi:hypothetical protein
MYMKRIKLNFAVVALLLGSVIAITQSSFTTAKAVKGKTSDAHYVFTGNALADDTDPANYDVEDGDPGCASGMSLPCVITVPDGTSLTDWLGARTKEQILSQADEKKSIQ